MMSSLLINQSVNNKMSEKDLYEEEYILLEMASRPFQRMF